LAVLYRGEPAAYCIPLNEELMAIYSIFIGPTVGTRLFPFFAKYGFGEGCLAALKRSLGSESRWKLALAFVSKLDAKRGQPSSRIVDRRNIVTDIAFEAMAHNAKAEVEAAGDGTEESDSYNSL
jgi:hypothetical protein